MRHCRRDGRRARTLFSAFRLLALFLLLSVVLCPSATAQRVSVAFADAPLRNALDEIARQAEVDIVYSAGLVDGVLVTCRFVGDDVRTALACVLSGTRLEARPTRDGQYVVARVRRPRSIAVSGFITDQDSGLPLPGAHIYLPRLRRGVITNRTGFFTFPAVEAGAYGIEVSYLGYEALDTTLVAGGRAARLQLVPARLLGEGVVIEASELQPGERAILPGVTAPSIARLERLPAALGGRDLLEALSWLPGVRRAGEVTGGLLVRGAGPDQNLYLIDGAPVYHPWHAFSLISTFQTETFQSVRLYRGSFPAQFGGRLSAVLDAELSDGGGVEPRARAAVNVHSARFLIESPITPRASFMLGGRRSYVDRLIGRRHPVSDAAGRVDTLKTGYYFYDWTAKLVFRPDQNSRISITSYRGKDDLDLRLPFDLSFDRSSWLRPADLLFEVGEFWQNQLFSARYERLLSLRWYVTGTAYDSRYQARESAFLQPTLSAEVESDYGVDLREVGLRLDLDYFRTVRSQTRLGLQVASRDFDSSVDARVQYNPGLTEVLREESRAETIEVSGYVQNTWTVRRNIDLLSGLRAVSFGNDRLIRLEPRLAARVTLHPDFLVLRAAASRNYQYLHRIRDRHSYLYDVVSSRWIPSTAETAPARGSELSLGVESRLQDVEIRLTSYVREQAHLLLPRDDFQSKEALAGPGIEIATLLGQYTEGSGRAAGLESAFVTDRGPVSATVSMTAERSMTRSGEDDFVPARFDVPRSAQAYLEYRFGAWTSGLAINIRSGYPVTVPVARFELSGPLDSGQVSYLHRPEVHNGRLPTYHRVDATIARTLEWLGASWRMQLQIYNVMNHRNVIDRQFAPTDLGIRVTNRRGLPILPLFEIELVL